MDFDWILNSQDSGGSSDPDYVIRNGKTGNYAVYVYPTRMKEALFLRR